ncbi:hypothetical protein [Pseudomonas psychrophila]|uniref:hypothetical protein n=1 Tax=Pseudomonas psychrophila TaxID=122355 RepID=UPI002E7BBEF9|nr:hypothetical protein [Pseudomonas psychrophila]WVI95862.1 hypothetical protein VR624_13710 [Pseudomonas psychrophila]
MALTNAGNLIFARDAGIAILDRDTLRVTRQSQPAARTLHTVSMTALATLRAGLSRG